MTFRLKLPASWLTWFLICALGIALAACSSPEERARAHYESGKELLQAGEFVKAGLEFRNALKFNDKLADAWFGLATVEEENHNWPVVSDSLQRVVELDANNFEALMKLAKLQLVGVKLDKALKNVNAANDLKTDDTDVLALRAAILFRLNDREGARADAERALSFNPDNPDAHAVLAADQMAQGNSKAALLYIDSGLAKDPNNLGLLLFKLKIYESLKDDPKFEAVLRQLIVANPGAKELRQALLNFLASRNRVADIEVEMRVMLAADPKDSAKALELVRLVATMRGAAEARKELEKLLAANPDVAIYKLALAQLDFSEKRADVATAAIEAIIAKGGANEDVLRAQLLLADMKTQLGQTEEAKSVVGDILSGDAKNADALALRANLSLNAGDVDSAVADLREALNQRPQSVPILELLGRAHERQGAVDLATDRLAEAVKASNYNPQVTMDYIAFLERQNKNEQVEAVLNEALARNPDDTRLLTAMARVRLNKQDWVGAESVAEALKKAGDKSGVSEQIVGAALLAQKKYDQSIEIFKDAYTSSPQTGRPMYSLFFAYVQAGKIGEAETFIQSILTANQNNAEALVLLGTIKTLQKKPGEAEAAYKLAIERQPANPIGYNALSKQYFAQNQLAEAEAVLRKGRDKAPGDLNIGLGLGNALELKNDTDGAITIYEEQLKTTPNALIIINNLASLLADYRTDAASLDRARQLSQRLETADVPQFKDTVGWVAYRKGDYRAALLNLEAAVAQLAGNALVRYHLAMTYGALKRNTDARDQFAKAEALLKDDDPLKEKIRTAVASLGAGN